MSDRLALDATLRAAAVAGFSLRSPAENSDLAQPKSHAIPVSALRYKLFKRKQGRLFIFAIDLSGSMALKRLGHAKSAILGLLRESYIKRDSVAIVGFRGVSAELLLPPSRSILRARRVLDSVGVGGGTPLSAGLARSLELCKQVGPKAGEIFLLVFTDGQANVPLKTKMNSDRLERQRQIELEITKLGTALKKSGVTSVVISTHDRYRSNDSAERIAAKLGAQCSRHVL
jgi:magnesium chelatase subunit D